MNFPRDLRAWCDTGSNSPYRRPFAPNPDWENAEVFIIGTNPATPLRSQFDSFEQYWLSLTRNPELFYSRYRAAHGGRASKSTNVAAPFLELLRPLNVLVTNVVWYPANRKKEIPKEEWSFGRRALVELIRHVKPRVLFCHGADAERFAVQYNPSVDRYRPVSMQKSQDNGLLVLAYHHFSGQGLKKGSQFQPARDLPTFAAAIHAHLRGS